MATRAGVYEIVNQANGKRYVGSAVHFEQRWKTHRNLLRRGKHHSPHLQASWGRHGEAAFCFRPLVICSRENLLMYEQAAIDAFLPEFNVLRFAGSPLGRKLSPETKAKISAANKGNTATLGYRHTPEAIEKLRAKQTGVMSPTRGVPRDRAAVAATAQAHRGMKRSEETKAKIAEKAKGRVRSAESIEKGAAKRRGVALSPEHRAKLLGNQHAAGRVQTEEEKLNRSLKSKAAWAARKAAGF